MVAVWTADRLLSVSHESFFRITCLLGSNGCEGADIKRPCSRHGELLCVLAIYSIARPNTKGNLAYFHTTYSGQTRTARRVLTRQLGRLALVFAI